MNRAKRKFLATGLYRKPRTGNGPARNQGVQWNVLWPGADFLAAVEYVELKEAILAAFGVPYNLLMGDNGESAH
jgi:hypothetical protein